MKRIIKFHKFINNFWRIEIQGYFFFIKHIYAEFLHSSMILRSYFYQLYQFFVITDTTA